MKNKKGNTSKDESLDVLLKETIEEIKTIIKEIPEEEVRVSVYFYTIHSTLLKITSSYVTFKKSTLFGTKLQKTKLHKVDLFYLLDIVEICRKYKTEYDFNKKYERDHILEYLRSLKKVPHATERNLYKLMRRIKRKFPFFVFKEQEEILVRDCIGFYN